MASSTDNNNRNMEELQQMSDETVVEMVDMGTWRRDHIVQMRNALEDAAATKLADGFPEKAGRIVGIVAVIDHLVLGKDVI